MNNIFSLPLPILTVIEAINVSKEFKGISVLKDINLEIKEGDKIGLIGLHNSGKSVLLQILSGNMRPSGGKVLMNGGKLNKRKIAYVPQIPLLDLSARVKDVVRYVGGDTKYLEELGVNPNSKVKELSLNERKRIFLALALNFSPEYLLVDEIGNDEYLRRFFLDFKGGSLVTAHRVKDLWDLISEVVIINKGVIVFRGKKDDLLYKVVKISRNSFSQELKRYDYVEEGNEIELWVKRDEKIHGEERLVEPDEVILRYYFRS